MERLEVDGLAATRTCARACIRYPYHATPQRSREELLEKLSN
jgi:hypothetical protein